MITNIYFNQDEIDVDDGTVCFYATDGVTTTLAGKFLPEKLPEVQSKLLHREFSAADAMCDQNIKEWLSQELKEMSLFAGEA